MEENWYALFVATHIPVTVEQAFMALHQGKKLKNKWTPEDIQDVLNLKKGGLRHKEIAKYYGVSKGVIDRLVFTQGASKKNISEEVAGEMMELYRQGWQVKDIADKYHVKSSTIYTRLRNARKQVKV